jgi:tripartite-type tricarboxylate transporter receptor subunit TctC
VPALVQHIQSGALKAIAVLAPQRTPLLPDVATPGEQGIKDFDATAWMGLFGPARLPAPIAAALQKVMADAAADRQLANQLAPQGFTLVGSTPTEFRQFLKTDIAKWADVVKATGATID